MEVARIPINQLSVKRRSGGKHALDILHRAKYLRIAAMIAAALEESDSDSDDSDDSDGDQEDEVNEQLEGIAGIYLQRVLDLDAPRRITQRVIQRKVVTVDSYSDDLRKRI